MVSTTYYVGSFEREVTLSSTVDKTYIGDHTIKMKAHVGNLGNQSPFQYCNTVVMMCLVAQETLHLVMRY
ncbi:hypothetical protein [Shewanella sp.]|uniref:hypothetical protein n=1 Tax=Shewanella sp. TaxID=50422 RepID=UPI004047899A